MISTPTHTEHTAEADMRRHGFGVCIYASPQFILFWRRSACTHALMPLKTIERATRKPTPYHVNWVRVKMCVLCRHPPPELHRLASRLRSIPKIHSLHSQTRKRNTADGRPMYTRVHSTDGQIARIAPRAFKHRRCRTTMDHHSISN